MSLEIISAKWGVQDGGDDHVVDITENLNGQIEDGELTIGVSNHLVAGIGDPCFGVVKTLKIDFVLNGKEISEDFLESTKIRISSKHDSYEDLCSLHLRDEKYRFPRQILTLNEVTLGTVCFGSSAYVDSCLYALEQFRHKVKFNAIKFFIANDLCISIKNHKRLKEYGVEVVALPAGFQFGEQFSTFMVKGLNEHIDTDFVLMFQEDGFIVKPDKWRDSWLEYDYIGAPWWYHDDHNVGNGGFTLRSKKLLQVLAEDDKISGCIHPEDNFICRVHGAYLRDERGIKFAPDEVAEVFSVENRPYEGQFGFHGGPLLIEYKKKIYEKA